MPTYEYRCASCNHRFTVSQSLAQHEKEKPTCPPVQEGNKRRSDSDLLFGQNQPKELNSERVYEVVVRSLPVGVFPGRQ